MPRLTPEGDDRQASGWLNFPKEPKGYRYNVMLGPNRMRELFWPVETRPHPTIKGKWQLGLTLIPPPDVLAQYEASSLPMTPETVMPVLPVDPD